MWKIAKEFDFCYGHRVWTQTLNPEFSLDSCLACRHIHGHQGKLIVYLESDQLQSGMVTDFKHLNWLKKWIDDTLDHKFIMDLSDPLRHSLFPLSIGNNVIELIEDDCFRVMPELYINLDNSLRYLRELYEGLVLVSFVPTSENLSKWIFEIASHRMSKIGVKVSGVQFFETPKSQSNYTID